MLYRQKFDALIRRYNKAGRRSAEPEQFTRFLPLNRLKFVVIIRRIFQRLVLALHFPKAFKRNAPALQYSTKNPRRSISPRRGGYGGNVYLDSRFCADRNRPGQFEKNMIISRDFNGLFNDHTMNYAAIYRQTQGE